MSAFLQAILVVGGAEVILAGALTAMPRLGRVGRAISDALARAPWLDAILSLLIWVPWVVAGVVWGWVGLAGAILGQMGALYLWIWVHELLHWRAARGPRIIRASRRLVGRWHNHLALWLTVPGVPVLALVRLLEMIFYPLLVWLLRFPRYPAGEWVNLSRHKFQDLVGHDLIWCLYCDWMTGVWSLGTEMLRNVESFWCPIRFGDARKIENCQSVFPDIEGGWVSADGSMAQVQAVLEEKYAVGDRAWFGHPGRRRADGEEHRKAMPEMDALVEDVLLEHSCRPRNCRPMPEATHRAEARAPFCDDRIEVLLQIEEGRIVDASFQGAACPICTASASLMTGALKDRTCEEAERLFRAFHDLMVDPDSKGHGADLGELRVLGGVQRFPSRVKCATLPWHTMVAAMQDGTRDGEVARSATTTNSGI